MTIANTIKTAKNTTLQLDIQVKEILHEKGQSKIFNETDYNYFKRKVKTAFNKAQAITDLFIQDNSNVTSDYHDYIF